MRSCTHIIVLLHFVQLEAKSAWLKFGRQKYLNVGYVYHGEVNIHKVNLFEAKVKETVTKRTEFPVKKKKKKTFASVWKSWFFQNELPEEGNAVLT